MAGRELQAGYPIELAYGGYLQDGYYFGKVLAYGGYLQVGYYVGKVLAYRGYL